MSKPIKVTESIMQKIMDEFRENIMSAKMFDGKVSYNKSFKWEKDDKATVIFSEKAFYKMLQLVYGFESEVAWHGTVTRDPEHENVFHIGDVFVYPQLVSGSNVETDQVAYQSWLYSLDDDVFNNLRMQAHSHVNFSTTPSGVDDTHQGKILEQLDDDMFYIFMIWNKKMERFIKIYDLKNNTLYETADVEIKVDTAYSFIDDARALVKPKYQTVSGFAGTNNTASTAPAKTTPATTPPANTPRVVTPANAAGQNQGAPASRPKPAGGKPPVGKSGAGYDPGYESPSGYYEGYYGGWGGRRY